MARSEKPKSDSKAASPKKRTAGRPNTPGTAVGRDAVIAKARSLLKQMPPTKITHIELARQAGVDPKLIRYYFEDTSTLLTEVVMQIAEDFSSRRAKARHEGETFKERLLVRIKTLIEILAENPHLHEMLLQRVVYGEAAGGAEIDALRQRMMVDTSKDLELAVAEGVAAGEIRHVDARYLYVAIIGMCEYPVNAFPLFSLLFGKSVDREQILSSYAHFLADLLYAGLAVRAEEKPSKPKRKPRSGQ